MMKTEEKFLTIEQAAKMLGFSESTLRRWLNEGFIPCLQVGNYGHIRIRLKDILEKIKTIES